MAISPFKRCFYEVVLEDSPCKIFFDLEIDLELNLNFDKVVEQKLIKRFNYLLIEELKLMIANYSNWESADEDKIEKVFKFI